MVTSKEEGGDASEGLVQLVGVGRPERALCFQVSVFFIYEMKRIILQEEVVRMR